MNKKGDKQEKSEYIPLCSINGAILKLASLSTTPPSDKNLNVGTKASSQ